MVALAWAASTPADIPNPRTNHKWVSDTAGVIDPPAEAKMNQRLEALHKAYDVEIAVVTVRDVVGTPRSFTTKLFNRWGVGAAETDRGLLVVQIIDKRRLEMETGYGLEGVLPDGWLGSMQAKRMVPYFKRGDHAGGLAAGIEAVARRLEGSGDVGGDAAPKASGTPRGTPAPRPTILGLGIKAFVSLLAFLSGLVALALGFAWKKRREGLCPTCKVWTVLLDEVADDDHLSEGQQAEEMVQSIDWKVRVCPQCAGIRVMSSSRWFSGYVRCDSCGHKTGKESRVTLSPATYSSSGTGRVTVICVHCEHESSRTFTIPMKVRVQVSSSSSSGGGFSSGGGGSFGGGSSGGGGAGSSW
jgi:uncharacterized protein